MSSKKRGYPYDTSGDSSPRRSLSGREKKKRRRLPGRIIIPILLLVLIGAAGYRFASSSEGGLAGALPFAKKLVALQLQVNGQEVLLLPDQQAVVNPRDTVQILNVKTDGWLSWGTSVASSDLDVKTITRKAVAIRDLFPQEPFENPKAVELRALLWNRQIGKVSLLVQLDAKDWLQKAGATSDLEKKTSYLEKALQENNSNVLVKTQLAGLYFESKKYNEAAKLYKEIDESGKSKSISERLLTTYQILNRTDDALAVYLDLLKMTEEQDTFKELLTYLKKRKSREDAARFLEAHQQDIPKAFNAAALLAIAEFSSESKNWSRAAATYEKAIKAGVKDSDVLYNLFVSYKRNEETDKAINALERYLQNNQGDAESWIQLGELYEKKGVASRAKTTYETVLQKNPQNKDALAHLVALMEKSNDKSGLQAAYEKLAAAQPKNKTAQHNLGVMYYESKKYDKATAAFEAIAAMDPKDVESRKYLLDLYRKAKNEKGELAALQALSQLDPQNAAYQDALFKYYDGKKDYKSMTAAFKTAAERDPDSVRLHNYQLYAAMKLGDKKAALKEIEHLIRLQPKEKGHLRKAADLYESTGNYPEALKKLEQLVKLDPKDKQAKEDYLRLKMQAISKKKPS